jgi:hypothetical protein
VCRRRRQTVFTMSRGMYETEYQRSFTPPPSPPAGPRSDADAGGSTPQARGPASSYGWSQPAERARSPFAPRAAGARSTTWALREAGISIDPVPQRRPSASPRALLPDPQPFAIEQRAPGRVDGSKGTLYELGDAAPETSSARAITARDAQPVATRPSFDKSLSQKEAAPKPLARKGLVSARKQGSLEQVRSLGAWLDESVSRLRPPERTTSSARAAGGEDAGPPAAGPRGRELDGDSPRPGRAQYLPSARRMGAMEAFGGLAPFLAQQPPTPDEQQLLLRTQGRARPRARALPSAERAMGEIWIEPRVGGGGCGDGGVSGVPGGGDNSSLMAGDDSLGGGGGNVRGEGAVDGARLESPAARRITDEGRAQRSGAGVAAAMHVALSAPGDALGARVDSPFSRQGRAGSPRDDGLSLQRKRRGLPFAGAPAGAPAGRASSAPRSVRYSSRRADAAPPPAAQSSAAWASVAASNDAEADAELALFGLQHKRRELRAFAERQPAESRGTHARQVWRGTHDSTSVRIGGGWDGGKQGSGGGGGSSRSLSITAREAEGGSRSARRHPAGWYPDNLTHGVQERAVAHEEPSGRDATRAVPPFAVDAMAPSGGAGPSEGEDWSTGQIADVHGALLPRTPRTYSATYDSGAVLGALKYPRGPLMPTVPAGVASGADGAGGGGVERGGGGLGPPTYAQPTQASNRRVCCLPTHPLSREQPLVPIIPPLSHSHTAAMCALPALLPAAFSHRQPQARANRAPIPRARPATWKRRRPRCLACTRPRPA